MNWLDILIILFLAGNVYSQAKKGFLKIVFEISALLLAVFGAVLFFQKVSDFLVAIFFKMPVFLAQILSFTLIWLGIYSLVVFIGEFFVKFWKLTILGRIDTFLGGLLGFLKGLFFAGLIFFILVIFSYFSLLPVTLEKGIEQSFLLKNTSEFFTKTIEIVNNWVLSEVGEKPNIFNYFPQIIFKKNISVVEKKESKKVNQDEPVETLKEIVKKVGQIQKSEK